MVVHYHLRRIGRQASLGQPPQFMDLLKTVTIIGRNVAEADYVLSSTDGRQNIIISRRHARIVLTRGGYRLHDDSLNGVFVNDIKIREPVLLEEGDTVTFGHPSGANYDAGCRVRQPDSEYQFLFERCDCQHQGLDMQRRGYPSIEVGPSMRAIQAPSTHQQLICSNTLTASQTSRSGQVIYHQQEVHFTGHMPRAMPSPDPLSSTPVLQREPVSRQAHILGQLVQGPGDDRVWIVVTTAGTGPSATTITPSFVTPRRSRLIDVPPVAHSVSPTPRRETPEDLSANTTLTLDTPQDLSMPSTPLGRSRDQGQPNIEVINLTSPEDTQKARRHLSLSCSETKTVSALARHQVKVQPIDSKSSAHHVKTLPSDSSHSASHRTCLYETGGPSPTAVELKAAVCKTDRVVSDRPVDTKTEVYDITEHGAVPGVGMNCPDVAIEAVAKPDYEFVKKECDPSYIEADVVMISDDEMATEQDNDQKSVSPENISDIAKPADVAETHSDVVTVTDSTHEDSTMQVEPAVSSDDNLADTDVQLIEASASPHLAQHSATSDAHTTPKEVDVIFEAKKDVALTSLSDRAIKRTCENTIVISTDDILRASVSDAESSTCLTVITTAPKSDAVNDKSLNDSQICAQDKQTEDLVKEDQVTENQVTENQVTEKQGSDPQVNINKNEHEITLVPTVETIDQTGDDVERLNTGTADSTGLENVVSSVTEAPLVALNVQPSGENATGFVIDTEKGTTAETHAGSDVGTNVPDVKQVDILENPETQSTSKLPCHESDAKSQETEKMKDTLIAETQESHVLKEIKSMQESADPESLETETVQENYEADPQKTERMTGQLTPMPCGEETTGDLQETQPGLSQIPDCETGSLTTASNKSQTLTLSQDLQASRHAAGFESGDQTPKADDAHIPSVNPEGVPTDRDDSESPAGTVTLSEDMQMFTDDETLADNGNPDFRTPQGSNSERSISDSQSQTATETGLDVSMDESDSLTDDQSEKALLSPSCTLKEMTEQVYVYKEAVYVTSEPLVINTADEKAEETASEMDNDSYETEKLDHTDNTKVAPDSKPESDYIEPEEQCLVPKSPEVMPHDLTSDDIRCLVDSEMDNDSLDDVGSPKITAGVVVNSAADMSGNEEEFAKIIPTQESSTRHEMHEEPTAKETDVNETATGRDDYHSILEEDPIQAVDNIQAKNVDNIQAKNVDNIQAKNVDSVVVQDEAGVTTAVAGNQEDNLKDADELTSNQAEKEAADVEVTCEDCADTLVDNQEANDSTFVKNNQEENLESEDDGAANKEEIDYTEKELTNQEEDDYSVVMVNEEQSVDSADAVVAHHEEKISSDYAQISQEGNKEGVNEINQEESAVVNNKKEGLESEEGLGDKQEENTPDVYQEDKVFTDHTQISQEVNESDVNEANQRKSAVINNPEESLEYAEDVDNQKEKDLVVNQEEMVSTDYVQICQKQNKNDVNQEESAVINNQQESADGVVQNQEEKELEVNQEENKDDVEEVNQEEYVINQKESVKLAENEVDHQEEQMVVNQEEQEAEEIGCAGDTDIIEATTDTDVNHNIVENESTPEAEPTPELESSSEETCAQNKSSYVVSSVDIHLASAVQVQVPSSSESISTDDPVMMSGCLQEGVPPGSEADAVHTETAAPQQQGPKPQTAMNEADMVTSEVYYDTEAMAETGNASEVEITDSKIEKLDSSTKSPDSKAEMAASENVVSESKTGDDAEKDAGISQTNKTTAEDVMEDDLNASQVFAVTAFQDGYSNTVTQDENTDNASLAEKLTYSRVKTQNDVEDDEPVSSLPKPLLPVDVETAADAELLSDDEVPELQLELSQWAASQDSLSDEQDEQQKIDEDHTALVLDPDEEKVAQNVTQHEVEDKPKNVEDHDLPNPQDVDPSPETPHCEMKTAIPASASLAVSDILFSEPFTSQEVPRSQYAPGTDSQSISPDESEDDDDDDEILATPLPMSDSESVPCSQNDYKNSSVTSNKVNSGNDAGQGDIPSLDNDCLNSSKREQCRDAAQNDVSSEITNCTDSQTGCKTSQNDNDMSQTEASQCTQNETEDVGMKSEERCSIEKEDVLVQAESLQNHAIESQASIESTMSESLLTDVQLAPTDEEQIVVPNNTVESVDEGQKEKSSSQAKTADKDQSDSNVMSEPKEHSLVDQASDACPVALDAEETVTGSIPLDQSDGTSLPDHPVETQPSTKAQATLVESMPDILSSQDNFSSQDNLSSLTAATNEELATQQANNEASIVSEEPATTAEEKLSQPTVASPMSNASDLKEPVCPEQEVPQQELISTLETSIQEQSLGHLSISISESDEEAQVITKPSGKRRRDSDIELVGYEAPPGKLQKTCAESIDTRKAKDGSSFENSILIDLEEDSDEVIDLENNVVSLVDSSDEQIDVEENPNVIETKESSGAATDMQDVTEHQAIKESHTDSQKCELQMTTEAAGNSGQTDIKSELHAAAYQIKNIILNKVEAMTDQTSEAEHTSNLHTIMQYDAEHENNSSKTCQEQETVKASDDTVGQKQESAKTSDDTVCQKQESAKASNFEVNEKQESAKASEDEVCQEQESTKNIPEERGCQEEEILKEPIKSEHECMMDETSTIVAPVQNAASKELEFTHAATQCMQLQLSLEASSCAAASPVENSALQMADLQLEITADEASQVPAPAQVEISNNKTTVPGALDAVEKPKDDDTTRTDSLKEDQIQSPQPEEPCASADENLVTDPFADTAEDPFADTAEDPFADTAEDPLADTAEDPLADTAEDQFEDKENTPSQKSQNSSGGHQFSDADDDDEVIPTSQPVPVRRMQGLQGIRQCLSPVARPMYNSPAKPETTLMRGVTGLGRSQKKANALGVQKLATIPVSSRARTVEVYRVEQVPNLQEGKRNLDDSVDCAPKRSYVTDGVSVTDNGQNVQPGASGQNIKPHNNPQGQQSTSKSQASTSYSQDSSKAKPPDTKTCPVKRPRQPSGDSSPSEKPSKSRKQDWEDTAGKNSVFEMVESVKQSSSLLSDLDMQSKCAEIVGAKEAPSITSTGDNQEGVHKEMQESSPEDADNRSSIPPVVDNQVSQTSMQLVADQEDLQVQGDNNMAQPNQQKLQVVDARNEQSQKSDTPATTYSIEALDCSVLSANADEDAMNTVETCDETSTSENDRKTASFQEETQDSQNTEGESPIPLHPMQVVDTMPSNPEDSLEIAGMEDTILKESSIKMKQPSCADYLHTGMAPAGMEATTEGLCDPENTAESTIKTSNTDTKNAEETENSNVTYDQKKNNSVTMLMHLDSDDKETESVKGSEIAEAISVIDDKAEENVDSVPENNKQASEDVDGVPERDQASENVDSFPENDNATENASVPESDDQASEKDEVPENDDQALKKELSENDDYVPETHNDLKKSDQVPEDHDFSWKSTKALEISGTAEYTNQSNETGNSTKIPFVPLESAVSASLFSERQSFDSDDFDDTLPRFYVDDNKASDLGQDDSQPLPGSQEFHCNSEAITEMKDIHETQENIQLDNPASPGDADNGNKEVPALDSNSDDAPFECDIPDDSPTTDEPATDTSRKTLVKDNSILARSMSRFLQSESESESHGDEADDELEFELPSDVDYHSDEETATDTTTPFQPQDKTYLDESTCHKDESDAEQNNQPTDESHICLDVEKPNEANSTFVVESQGELSDCDSAVDDTVYYPGMSPQEADQEILSSVATQDYVSSVPSDTEDFPSLRMTSVATQDYVSRIHSDTDTPTKVKSEPQLPGYSPGKSVGSHSGSYDDPIVLEDSDEQSENEDSADDPPHCEASPVLETIARHLPMSQQDIFSPESGTEDIQLEVSPIVPSYDRHGVRESPISSTPAEPGTKVTIKQQAVAPRRPVPDASLPLFDDDDDDQDFGAPDINIDSLLSQSDGNNDTGLNTSDLRPPPSPIFNRPEETELDMPQLTPVKPLEIKPLGNNKLSRKRTLPDLDDEGVSSCPGTLEDVPISPPFSQSQPSKKRKLKAVLEKLDSKFGKVTPQPSSSQFPPHNTRGSQETPGDLPSAGPTRRQILGQETDPTPNLSYQTLKSKEIRALSARLHLPQTSIAVVGNTGAGKSSLMNAVLDHANILPTSCMQACTAVVVDITASQSSFYEADIHFLSHEEWYDELQMLLRILTNRDGRVVARQPDPDKQPDAAAAWAKVKAVYGSDFKDGVTLERLQMRNKITCRLGDTERFQKSDPLVIRQLVDKFIASTGQEENQWWPIVKRVSMRIPNCGVCNNGAVLVDLPGIQDSNAARDRIAKDHLKNCNAVWVVADIRRAVNDKTAKALLGEHFRRQLMMDGQYGAISFVCTMTDQMMKNEIVSGLHMDSEVLPLRQSELQLKTKRERVSQAMKAKQEHQEQVKQEINVLATDIAEDEKILDKLSQALDEEEAEAEMVQKTREIVSLITEKMDMRSSLQGQLETLERDMTDLEHTKLKLDKETEAIRQKLSAMCAKARNKFVIREIQKDFTAGIKEMYRRAKGIASDDEDSDDESDADFADARRRGDQLKVFCVSAVEYLKLCNLFEEEGPPQVFDKVEDTGIPQLKELIHQMTVEHQERDVKKCVTLVHQLVSSIHAYLQDHGTHDEVIRENVQQHIEAEFERTRTSILQGCVAQVIQDMDVLFNEALKSKVSQGQSEAVVKAPTTAVRWGSKVNKENPAESGYHWAVYKATVARHGVYKSAAAGNINFNEDLTGPCYDRITLIWNQIFSEKIEVILHRFKSSVKNTLSAMVLGLLLAVQNFGIASQRLTPLHNQVNIMAETQLSDTNVEVSTFIQNEQRDINRIMTTEVQQELISSYNNATKETGSGCFNRMKSVMETYVTSNKSKMFDHASLQLLRKLHALEMDVMALLTEALKTLMDRLLVLFEPLWKVPANSQQLRDAFLAGVLKVLRQSKMLMIQLGCDITQHHSPQAAHARNDSIDDDAITVTPTQSRALSNTGTSLTKVEPLPGPSGVSVKRGDFPAYESDMDVKPCIVHGPKLKTQRSQLPKKSSKSSGTHTPEDVNLVAHPTVEVAKQSQSKLCKAAKLSTSTSKPNPAPGKYSASFRDDTCPDSREEHRASWSGVPQIPDFSSQGAREARFGISYTSPQKRKASFSTEAREPKARSLPSWTATSASCYEDNSQEIPRQMDTSIATASQGHGSNPTQKKYHFKKVHFEQGAGTASKMKEERSSKTQRPYSDTKHSTKVAPYAPVSHETSGSPKPLRERIRVMQVGSNRNILGSPKLRQSSATYSLISDTVGSPSRARTNTGSGSSGNLPAQNKASRILCSLLKKTSQNQVDHRSHIPLRIAQQAGNTTTKQSATTKARVETSRHQTSRPQTSRPQSSRPGTSVAGTSASDRPYTPQTMNTIQQIAGPIIQRIMKKTMGEKNPLK